MRVVIINRELRPPASTSLTILCSVLKAPRTRKHLEDQKVKVVDDLYI